MLIELEPVFRARHGFTHGPQKKKNEETTLGLEPNSSFMEASNVVKSLTLIKEIMTVNLETMVIPNDGT